MTTTWLSDEYHLLALCHVYVEVGINSWTSVCLLPFFLNSLPFPHFRFRFIPQLQNLQTKDSWRAVFTFCSRLELRWSAQYKQLLISGSLQGDWTVSRTFCSIALSSPFSCYITAEVIMTSTTYAISSHVYTSFCNGRNPDDSGEGLCTELPAKQNWMKRFEVFRGSSFICISSSFNPLKTKCRLLYLKTQFVPRSKHFSSRL